MKIVVGGLFCVAVLAGVTRSQFPVPIRGGMLNGRALSLPKPEYPEEARSHGIGGRVGVDIVFDEDGNVISAKALQNDERTVRNAAGEIEPPVPVDASLRAAAEKAAMLAKFAPVMLNDLRVKVAGRLVYNFVADASDKPPRIGDIYGQSLRPRAFALPEPEYPAAAKEAGVKGQVAVYIVVGPDGNVISAEAVSGPTLLRPAAEEAARKAKFQISILGTTPVRDAGVVLYEFK